MSDDLQDLRDELRALRARLDVLERRAPRARRSFVPLEIDEDGVQVESGAELLEGEGREISFSGSARISRGTQIVGPVRLGDGFFANRRCFVQGSTTIGTRVALGPGVQILTDTHEIGPAEKRAGDGRVLPVSIGDGAWIGAGAIILPGVSIGDGAVIAAGAIVTRDVPPSTLAAGSPAVAKRDLDAPRPAGRPGALTRLLRRLRRR